MALFSEKSLQLMPSNALTGLSNSLLLDRNKKQAGVQSCNAKISKLQGTSQLDTPTQGKAVISSGGNSASMKLQKGMSSASTAFSNAASVMGSPSTNPGGVPVFVPGTAESTPQELTAMIAENNAYFAQAGPPSNSSPELTSTIAALGMKRTLLQNEVAEIDITQGLINIILTQRGTGEQVEPKLNIAALSMDELATPYKAVVAAAVEETKRFVDNAVIAPFSNNRNLIAALNSQLSGIEGIAPTFDLEYGPPISAGNNFVLSRDGLYYDSRNEKVPQIVPNVLSSTMWTLEFDSNKGGRGVTFNEDESTPEGGTIFDLEMDLGINNQRVLDFYRYDDVLQQFVDDRQSQLTTVSGYISEIMLEGYSETDALVQSYYSQLGAVVATYHSKIKRRKRQLEIAAIYGRNAFFVTAKDHPLGEGVFFKFIPPVGKSYEYLLTYDDLDEETKTTTWLTTGGGDTVAWDTENNEVAAAPNSYNVIAKEGMWEEVPRIPINDFSYLKSTEVPLAMQRKITLFSEDLDTIIAPYQAQYVIAPDTPENFTEKLSVDMIGFGDWVHRESTGSFSSTTPEYKSLTDDIVSEDLKICYNFLDPAAVTQPSGSLYGLNNAAEGSTRLDGKLVAHSQSFLFPSGVGTAFLGGTIFDEEAKFDTSWDNAKGSYVRLPNITKDYEETSLPCNGVKQLDNLFYQPSGVTFDFWTYVPTLVTDLDSFHRYRLVLSNENSGPVFNDYITATNSRPTVDFGESIRTSNPDRTLGLMVGWRDRGNPKGDGATKNNSPSGLEFIIAPTVSQNQYYTQNPNISWGHSTCIAERWNGPSLAPSINQVKELGMYVTSSIVTDSGKGIADASGAYVHFNIAFDYELNETRICLDGEHLMTSALNKVLGVRPQEIKTPTPVKIDLADQSQEITQNYPNRESFLGNNIYDEYVTPERVAFPVFTPWIIGGGYSDNMPTIPGSPYRPMGFLGSNTNNTYQETNVGAQVETETIGTLGDFITGQHTPPLSNSKGGSDGDRFRIPRSGLNGHMGSFKIYSKPLSIIEAKINFDAQQAFFKSVLL